MAMGTKIKRWTLEELHSLPEDGNKYELVFGELFVTPAPTNEHETIAARLTRLLDPYVAAQSLGLVYRPRAVIRIARDVEVEPDLMVRLPHPEPGGDWSRAPRPILVVEILSPSTRRRDHEQKRALYMDAGIVEYWIVDADTRTITIVSPGRPPRIEDREVHWSPRGASDALVVPLAEVFG